MEIVYNILFIRLKGVSMFAENDKLKIIGNIQTSMEMENQNLTNFDITLLNDFADNKISMDEAMKSIQKMNFISF